MYRHNTFDRRILLGASRERKKDAEVLYNQKRWAGSMYVAGYAIECSLKALICHQEGKYNFQDVRNFKKFEQKNMHSLDLFLQESRRLQHAIHYGRYKDEYEEAWNIIIDLWSKNAKDQLRYWDKQGNRSDCERFLSAVKLIHRLILHLQGESS